MRVPGSTTATSVAAVFTICDLVHSSAFGRRAVTGLHQFSSLDTVVYHPRRPDLLHEPCAR